MNRNHHIHFIGICGVAMSALAIAFQKRGWKVTGSDVGFYPPISDHLKKHKINFYPGWHPEKMMKDGKPDLVVVGNVAGSTNPELFSARENHLNFKSYPEVVAEYIVSQNSIVCSGTYGKTSSATLLTWILSNAGLDPSYMFGGISLNFEESAKLKSEDGKYSILEGDEYKTARWDNRPKFKLYSPTHLLLTSVSWDHADVYPTEESYLEAFNDLVKMVPARGLIVACVDGPNVSEIVKSATSKIVTYGKASADYVYSNVKQTSCGIEMTIEHKKEMYKISSSVLGEHMAENICGCFAMANEIGIDIKIIINSISSFLGVKRRLEKRYEGRITIYDDLAHSPAKARATLKTLRSIYPKNTIVAVFEPNSGNRKTASFPGYHKAFANADEIIIPEFTKIKIDPTDTDPPYDAEKLSEIVKQSHRTVSYIPDDNDLIAHIQKNTKKEDVVVFLGSHGFRGMIEKLITNSYLRIGDETISPHQQLQQ